VSSPARTRLGQGLAALDAFDQAGDDFPEAGRLDAVPQVGEAFDDGDASPGQLIQMEAEVDQLTPRHLAAAEQATLFDRGACDQVQVHTLEAHFQVHRIDGV